MRLVSALLFVALTGSTTLAEEAKPADSKPEVSRRRVPLRVVRMLPETHQVLLFDKDRGTHVVAEVGQNVDGYLVEEIDGDEVTLIADNGAVVILAAPDATWRRALGRKAAPKPAGKQGAEPQPVDPYADTTTPASSSGYAAAPSGPVASSGSSGLTAGEGGVRVASASDQAPTAVPVDDAQPADPYAQVDPGIAAFADAVGATPGPSVAAPVRSTAAPATAPAPAAPAASSDRKPATQAATTDAAAALAAAATGSPAPSAARTTSAPSASATSAPATSAPTTPPAAAAANAFTVSRGDVDAALADFGSTAVTFDAKFVANGLRIDSIADGTILAKLGLRKGDVLTAVDNQPLLGFDDAATLYARAGTVRGATLSVLRAGKPLTLRVTIR